MWALTQTVLLTCHVSVIQAGADSCSFEVSLPGKYAYRELPLTSVNESTSLVFDVRACADARVAISSSTDLNTDMIEVVFGGYNNTKCVIRPCLYNYSSTCSSSYFECSSLLSCTEFRTVWVAWGPPGVRMGVGVQPDNKTAATTTRQLSLGVHHVWISMFTGNTGEWRINVSCPEENTSAAQNRTTSVATSESPATANDDVTNVTVFTTLEPEPPTASSTTTSSASNTANDAAGEKTEDSGTTEPQPGISKNVVKHDLETFHRCRCQQLKPSSSLALQSAMEAARKAVVNMTEEMKLRETTSARRRQLESARDDRGSAKFLGTTAVALIVGTVVVLTAPDLFALLVWTAVHLGLVKDRGS